MLGEYSYVYQTWWMIILWSYMGEYSYVSTVDTCWVSTAMYPQWWAQRSYMLGEYSYVVHSWYMF